MQTQSSPSNKRYQHVTDILEPSKCYTSQTEIRLSSTNFHLHLQKHAHTL